VLGVGCWLLSEVPDCWLKHQQSGSSRTKTSSDRKPSYESTNARPDVLRSPDRSPRKSIASLPFLTGESNKPNDWNLSLRLKWRNCFPSSTKKARRNFQSPLALLAIRPVVVGMAHCLTAKRLPTPDIEGILSCRDSLPFSFSCSRSEC